MVGRGSSRGISRSIDFGLCYSYKNNKQYRQEYETTNSADRLMRQTDKQYGLEDETQCGLEYETIDSTDWSMRHSTERITKKSKT